MTPRNLSVVVVALVAGAALADPVAPELGASRPADGAAVTAGGVVFVEAPEGYAEDLSATVSAGADSAATVVVDDCIGACVRQIRLPDVGGAVSLELSLNLFGSVKNTTHPVEAADTVSPPAPTLSADNLRWTTSAQTTLAADVTVAAGDDDVLAAVRFVDAAPTWALASPGATHLVTTTADAEEWCIRAVGVDRGGNESEASSPVCLTIADAIVPESGTGADGGGVEVGDDCQSRQVPSSSLPMELGLVLIIGALARRPRS